jgi:hypothetical protein
MLKQATKEQLNAARQKAIDHYNACHAAGVQVEWPEKIMVESLEIVMMGDEEPTEYDDRAMFTSRNYSDCYSCPDDPPDSRILRFRQD